MITSIRILIVVIMMITNFACPKGGTCPETTSQETTSVNFFDLQPGSPHNGDVVAVFTFTQSTTDNPQSNCISINECTIDLIITNTTSESISFDYNINVVVNAVSWNEQGFANIGPNGTLNVNNIENSCTDITLGLITLNSTGIDYN